MPGDPDGPPHCHGLAVQILCLLQKGRTEVASPEHQPLSNIRQELAGNILERGSGLWVSGRYRDLHLQPLCLLDFNARHAGYLQQIHMVRLSFKVL